MSALVAVAVAGGLGAPARYVLDAFVADRAGGVFPWGTLVVNVSGSLVLGMVTGLALYHGLGELPRVAAGAGFCGAYTTFSTFSYETVRLLEDGSVLEAGLNVGASLVVGALAAAVGLAVMAVA